jgi:hypothetical protein
LAPQDVIDAYQHRLLLIGIDFSLSSESGRTGVMLVYLSNNDCSTSDAKINSTRDFLSNSHHNAIFGISIPRCSCN